MITYFRLRELLDYNPETGNFHWKMDKKSHGGGRKKGDIAGYRQPPNKYGKAKYIRFNLEGRMYQGHRLAWLWMTGEWPKGQIDHINGDGYDNRWKNLRDVCQSANMRNQKLSKRNKSGIVGVCKNKRKDKWQVSIKVDGKDKFLGYFDDFFEACCARKSAENKYGYHENHGRRVTA